MTNKTEKLLEEINKARIHIFASYYISDWKYNTEGEWLKYKDVKRIIKKLGRGQLPRKKKNGHGKE